jgi:outer membrane protein assembly factor BamD
LDNVLEDFPDTKLKEEILIYSLRSKTELAINSVHRLQNERINDAANSFNNFSKSFPNSDYLDEAKRLNNRLDNARLSYQNRDKAIQEAKQQSEEKAIELEKERKKIS